MPVIKETEAAQHVCPWNGFRGCNGGKCMAWAWHGRSFEETTTHNLAMTPEGLRPTGLAAAAPEGDGWFPTGQPYERSYENSAKLKLPKAAGQRWHRRVERTRGYCSRAQIDPYDRNQDLDEEIPF